MKILKKCVSHYSHSSFLWLQIFEIWVYIENMCLIIHIVPFYGYKFLKYGYTREWKFIFYLLLKSCPRSIFLKFEICPRWLHFTLLWFNNSTNFSALELIFGKNLKICSRTQHQNNPSIKTVKQNFYITRKFFFQPVSVNDVKQVTKGLKEQQICWRRYTDKYLERM